MPKLNAELKAELLATGTVDVDESLLVGTSTLIYSARLRVSEVVKLKLEDVDTDSRYTKLVEVAPNGKA